jgi:hypothetical protein
MIDFNLNSRFSPGIQGILCFIFYSQFVPSFLYISVTVPTTLSIIDPTYTQVLCTQFFFYLLYQVRRGICHQYKHF